MKSFVRFSKRVLIIGGVVLSLGLTYVAVARECVKIEEDPAITCKKENESGAPYACDHNRVGGTYQKCPGEKGQKKSGGSTLVGSATPNSVACAGSVYECVSHYNPETSSYSYSWDSYAQGACGNKTTITVTPPSPNDAPCPTPTPPGS